MTDSHADISALLEETMLVLTPKDTPLTADAGTDALSNWIDLLRGVDNTAEIVVAMKAVQAQLRQSQPADLPYLLTTLAEKTQLLGVEMGPEGDMAPRLEALSGALRSTAGSLSGAETDRLHD